MSDPTGTAPVHRAPATAARNHRPGAAHAPDTSHAHFRTLPVDVEAFRQLAELALDLRSTWNHASDELWRRIDPVLWDLTHNPWAVLRTASRAQSSSSPRTRQFRAKLDELRRTRHEALPSPVGSSRRTRNRR